jgi:hypothetical protein
MLTLVSILVCKQDLLLARFSDLLSGPALSNKPQNCFLFKASEKEIPQQMTFFMKEQYGALP